MSYRSDYSGKMQCSQCGEVQEQLAMISVQPATAASNCIIPSRGEGTVGTGLVVSLPPGTYARIAPRSGLAIRNFIDVWAGVVDSDYRGEIKVILFNHSAEDFAVQAGDRIAQLILEKIETPQVKKVAALDDTDRGAGGFGSTGTKQLTQSS